MYEDIKFIQAEILLKGGWDCYWQTNKFTSDFKLLKCALVCTHADQEDCQGLVKDLDKYRLKEEILLRVTDARGLPNPMKMAFRTPNIL
jgi:hypothetical protein